MEFTKEILKRFWTKVQKTDYCWNWIAAKSSKGYGRFKIQGRLYLPHRISWEIHDIDIPEGLNVLHECDNRLCVKPDHLFLGTQSDNMKDCANKKRLAVHKYPNLFRG